MLERGRMLRAMTGDFGRRRAVRAVTRVLAWLLGWAVRIAVPITCASILLRAFSHHTTIDGVSFRIQATILSRPGLSADTTLGNWEFPHFDGLPIGIHVTPVNVDLLRLTRAASTDTPTFVAALKTEFIHQMPSIVVWLVAETLLGLAVGVLLVAMGTLAWRHLREPAAPVPGPRWSVRQRVLSRVGVATFAIAALAVYGVASYNPHWVKQSRLTGTLAALQLFPAQLKEYYAHQSKAYDALGAVIGIQAALQQQIERADTPPTAYNIMYISDVHLAAIYPLIKQYAMNFDVKLVVNTGDETEFGGAAELTPSFTSAIAALTKSIPMIWLAGNHDSPDVAAAMAAIPGVTVLGAKRRSSDGSVTVAATSVDAGGLTIAGLPDPRIYGGVGAFGSADKATVETLQKSSVDAAVRTVGDNSRFDIFATHEPVAAAELSATLPGRIRQTNSGHLHAQNSTSQIQTGDTINLVEGSTGAGGLDNIDRGSTPPIEFSIESVAASCQFTKVTRFQLHDAAAAPDLRGGTFGDDVSVSTLYLKPQTLTADRICAAPVRVGLPRDIG